MSQTQEKLLTIAASVVPNVEWDASKIDESLDDLGVDSLDKSSLILEAETEFSIKISDDQYDDLNSLGDIANFIESHS